MTNRPQELNQASGVTIVGAVVRAFARIAMQAQWLQILNKVCAAVFDRDNVVNGQRAVRTTAQANATKPVTHGKPVTPMVCLPFNFRMTFVLIPTRRDAICISIRLTPCLRQFVNTFFIVLIPALTILALAIRVGQTPRPRLLELMISISPVRAFLFLAKMFWVFFSSLAFSLKYLVAVLMVVRIRLGVYLISMRGMVLGFLLQPFIPVFHPLIAMALDVYRVVFSCVVSLSLLRAGSINVSIAFCLLRCQNARFAFGTVFAAFGAEKEVIQRLKGMAQAAYFAVEEGKLYNFHVNLHKRLAAPAGVSAPRGLSMCSNYSTFVASDQVSSALGGGKCL